MKVAEIGNKTVYSAEGREASEWVSALSPKSSSIDSPKFSSGLKVREVKGNDKGVVPNGLGIMCNKSNNLMKSQTDVFLLSGKPTDKGCCNFDLTAGEGWRRAISLFSARKLSKDTWITHNDEYLVPIVYKDVFNEGQDH